MEVTGDKCVILNKEHGAYVVMKLEDYKDFHQNRLGSSKNSFNSTQVRQSSTSENTENIRLIPQKSTDIKEFEIKKPIKIMDMDEEDIYYTEPLIE